jgi:hypothetical protein
LHIQFTWLEIFKETQLHSSLLVHLVEGYNIYIWQYDIYAMTITVMEVTQFFWIMQLVAWPWINESWWIEVYNWVRRVWWMIEVNDDGWIGLVWSYQQLESYQRTFRNLKPKKKEKMLIAIIDRAPTTQHDWDPFFSKEWW